MTNIKEFSLWLEFEETNGWDDLTNDFVNIIVRMNDGRKYGINVWTYKYLEEAKGDSSFVVPPDLFLAELTRPCIERSISELLKEGDLETVLNSSIFSLEFLDPWLDIFEMKDAGKSLEDELSKELDDQHELANREFDVLAKRQDNDDILVELENGEIAVVHLTWSHSKEEGKFPLAKIYKDSKDFWLNDMKEVIEEFK